MNDVLPGVPPLVAHAQQVIETNRRACIRAGWVSTIAALTLGALVTMLDAEIGPPLLAMLLLLFPFVAIATARTSPTLIRDAEAILESWETLRAEWATRAVEASLDGASEDVQAWSRTHAQLTRLRGQRS